MKYSFIRLFMETKIYMKELCETRKEDDGRRGVGFLFIQFLFSVQKNKCKLGES